VTEREHMQKTAIESMLRGFETATGSKFVASRSMSYAFAVHGVDRGLYHVQQPLPMTDDDDGRG